MSVIAGRENSVHPLHIILWRLVAMWPGIKGSTRSASRSRDARNHVMTFFLTSPTLEPLADRLPRYVLFLDKATQVLEANSFTTLRVNSHRPSEMGSQYSRTTASPSPMTKSESFSGSTPAPAWAARTDGAASPCTSIFRRLATGGRVGEPAAAEAVVSSTAGIFAAAAERAGGGAEFAAGGGAGPRPRAAAAGVAA